MRMRRKRHLDTRMERCGHLLVPEPKSLRGRWLDELPYSEVHLELGCGKGRFTAETAKTSPETLFVAVEKISNVLIAALELTMQSELNNVRYISDWADDIKDFFALGEVSRIYINFCDPWPARRHMKRRLTHQRFLEMYRHVLTPNGEIHFKTDNLPLFEYSLSEFDRCGYKVGEISYNLHECSPKGIMTDYEQRFYEQGFPIYRCVAV